ncbi:MAG: DNA mismatch repair endonuclease MutL [Armatimonadota bacterium]
MNTTLNKNKINLLDTETRELIAAGEVIERPLSAVKELMENSIDAGSTKITVEIKQGGHTQIIITDDGCGMNKEDSLNSLQRFATSKIKKIDDLETLTSLGFRGEAVPSIAAVSKMQILTNDDPDKTGTSIYIEGGKIKEVREIPYRKGTKITVSDIYFNTPARRKFQKAASTEFTQIYNLVNKYAFYYKDIHFILINNGKEALNLPSQLDNLTKFTRFIKQDKENFVNIEAATSSMKISGFISDPETTKKSRDGQVIFINGRIIKPGTVNQALNEAYSQYTERGRFPYCLLFISIDPSRIDVNVHPTKSEIRFSDSSQVYKTVFNAVIQKLRQTASPVSDFQAYDTSSQFNNTTAASYENIGFSFTERTAEDTEYTPQDLSIYGQINETYAYTITGGNIIIFDIHAAHERINYEKFKNKLKSTETVNQKLLDPVVIELTKQQQEILNKEISLFKNMGFEIEEFGKDSFIIHSIPQNIPSKNIKSYLSDLFTELESEYSNYKSTDEATEAVIKSMACKASAKSGEKLNYYEIKKLFEDLNKTENPARCPHGRPAFVKFTNKELDKMFKRT